MNIAGVKEAWLPEVRENCLPVVYEPIAEPQETLDRELIIPRLQTAIPDEIWENLACLPAHIEPHAESCEARLHEHRELRRPDAKRRLRLDHVADMHISAFERPIIPDYRENCLAAQSEPMAEAPEGLLANVSGVTLQRETAFLPDVRENCLPVNNEPFAEASETPLRDCTRPKYKASRTIGTQSAEWFKPDLPYEPLICLAVSNEPIAEP